MTQPRRFIVPARGVGRKDYSTSVESATQASMRGHQARYSSVLSIVLPTVPFGIFYTVYFIFPGGGVRALANPRHFYNIINTTGRNALVLASFFRFNSWADYLIHNVDEWYGTVYGYGKAELHWTNGIKTEEGKVYAAGVCEYSERPTFTIHMTSHSLFEEDVYV